MSLVESFPEENKEVFLFNANYPSPDFAVGKLKKQLVSYEWQIWDIVVPFNDYTHWMPLPEPPIV